MLSHKEIEAIKTRLEAAFKPLRCIVEIWDYNEKLRFKVFSPTGQGVIEIPEIVLRELRDETRLQEIIEDTRAQITAKGFSLD